MSFTFADPLASLIAQPTTKKVVRVTNDFGRNTNEIFLYVPIIDFSDQLWATMPLDWR